MLIRIYRLAHILNNLKIPLVPKLLYYIQYFLFNSSVPPGVIIGPKTKFAYGGIGVVIHERCKIGSNCMIGQGVTIGGKSRHYMVPEIGDNVYVSAGARILGPVVIGDNVIIGANSVVIKDVENNTIVAGVPAKVIKTGINPNDYI